MNIVLVGIKHAGKSALGKALAEMRDTLFVDSDELIEANYLLRTGESLSCREIFAKLGRQEFRKLEAAAIEQLNESTEEDDQERVIALGGGVADNPDVNEEQLKELGLVVYISIPRDIAWERIVANGIPAYLAGEEDPRAIFNELSEERENFYEKHADVIIQLEDGDLEENLAILEDQLAGYLSECC